MPKGKDIELPNQSGRTDIYVDTAVRTQPGQLERSMGRPGGTGRAGPSETTERGMAFRDTPKPTEVARRQVDMAKRPLYSDKEVSPGLVNQRDYFRQQESQQPKSNHETLNRMYAAGKKRK